MNLLIDNALSPVVASKLRQSGHDVVHVRDIGMQEAGDESILLLAGNRPEEAANLLADLLPRVSADLAKGSIVTVTDDRIRIRALPVAP